MTLVRNRCRDSVFRFLMILAASFGGELPFAHGQQATMESKNDSSQFVWSWSESVTFFGPHACHLAIATTRPEDRAIEIELNASEPLDLSELLGSLDAVPSLKDQASALEKSPATSSTARIGLASDTQPLLIGSAANEDKTKLTSNEPTASKVGADSSTKPRSLPRNPLRDVSPKTETTKTDSTTKTVEPTAPKLESSSPVESSVASPDATKSEPLMIGGKSELSPSVSSSKEVSPKLDPPQGGQDTCGEEKQTAKPKPADRAKLTPSAEPVPIAESKSEANLGDESSKSASPPMIEVRSLESLDQLADQETASEKVPHKPTSPSSMPADTNAKSTRPRMKSINIGNEDQTQKDQESPSLDTIKDPPSVSDRLSDKEALTGTEPKANSKTFVDRPTSRPNELNARSTRSKESPTIVDPRLARVENCLAYYLTNLESTVDRSPWSVMHAMLPFGVEGEILVGTRSVNAIQWLCYNGTCRNQRLFTPTQRFFKPNVGGGVQGHEGQFLAMLAQSQISADYPIVVGGRQYKVEDLVRYEMATCRERTELTFKLIGLSYYVDTSQVWTTDRRSRWNIEKLVKEELAQPVNGAACGGTHRLMGLTFALKQRRAENKPIDGHFARADKYVQDYIRYTWSLQNPDGSFSTNWFESRGNEPKMERKVQTTGHMLEWLAFTCPDAELQSPRFLKSIDFLLSQIWDQRQHKWPIGPRGHATRALALYQQRTQGVQPGERRDMLAERIDTMRQSR